MSESSFTGKEEDVEVGLQYFGKRYYAPLLGRWVSADPLTVHALGADLNVYAYVSGGVLKNVDPRGLQETGGSGGAPTVNPSGGFEGAGGANNGQDNVGVAAGPQQGCWANMSCSQSASGMPSPTPFLPPARTPAPPPAPLASRAAPPTTTAPVVGETLGARVLLALSRLSVFVGAALMMTGDEPERDAAPSRSASTPQGPQAAPSPAPAAMPAGAGGPPGGGSGGSGGSGPKGPRLFRNLDPSTPTTPVRPSVLEQRGGKWVEITPSGQVRSASGSYNFVTQNGRIYAMRVSLKAGATRIGHADIARGNDVEYAGRIQFSGRTTRGEIRWWSNESGHFRPGPEYSGQAGLPSSSFRPAQFE